jgi:Ca-activated chloride channel family protein
MRSGTTFHEPSLLCLLYAAGIFAVASGFAPAQDSIIIKAEAIRVPVTAVDKGGRFIQGLKQPDFEVLEDGVPQELTSFATEDSDLRTVLLMDVSGSMATRLADVKKAATQFVAQMGPRDLVKAVQFNEKVTPLSDFSKEKPGLIAAIGKAAAGGGTALHNALWTALADLESQKKADGEEQRHRAIVVLTDGDDTSSAISSDEVLLRANRADAAVYSLSLDRFNGQPVTDSAAAVFLRELGEKTGGQLLFPEMHNLDRTYRQLADELRHQYTLGYVSSNRSTSGNMRKITVTVKSRRVEGLRYRRGYFPSSRSGE